MRLFKKPLRMNCFLLLPLGLSSPPFLLCSRDSDSKERRWPHWAVVTIHIFLSRSILHPYWFIFDIFFIYVLSCGCIWGSLLEDGEAINRPLGFLLAIWFLSWGYPVLPFSSVSWYFRLNFEFWTFVWLSLSPFMFWTFVFSYMDTWLHFGDSGNDTYLLDS